MLIENIIKNKTTRTTLYKQQYNRVHGSNEKCMCYAAGKRCCKESILKALSCKHKDNQAYWKSFKFYTL